MNQIIQLLKESNSRMEKIMNAIKASNPMGEDTRKDIELAQQECEKQLKAMNVVVNAYAIHSKNQRTLKGLERMGLMDENTALEIGIGNIELDYIKCPLQVRPITRRECLDRSGKAENLDDCKGCDLYDINRDLVLGPKPFVA